MYDGELKEGIYMSKQADSESSKNKRPGEYPPELTDEDHKILDRIHDRMREERESDPGEDDDLRNREQEK